MGVLDDAIREHLDLKRQRGAPEAEIARAEEEAIGPARRSAVPSIHDEDENGDASRDETLIVPPMDDVAPPPLASERHDTPTRIVPGERPKPTRAVHDIDEDPLAPPPPVTRPDVDDEPTSEPPVDSPEDDAPDGQGGRLS